MTTSKKPPRVASPLRVPSPARPAPDPAAAERFIAGESGHPGIAPAIPDHPEMAGAIPPRARAAAGTATLRTRKSGRVVRRMMIYLDPSTAAALDAYRARERRELSAVVEAAILEYLEARL